MLAEVEGESGILVGLISDTHGLLRREVFTALTDVDLIIHAGDIGDPDILTELQAIAPVAAVWGNTDDMGIRALVPERQRLEVGGIVIEVVHGQQYGRPTARKVAADHATADLVVFGHSHQPEIERVGDLLVVNPGSAGPARFNLPVTVALASVDDGQIEARLVRLVQR